MIIQWIIVALLIMCGVGFSVLTFKESYITSIILPGDTIIILLSNSSYLPPFLNIILTGQKDAYDGCTGRMTAVTCTDIKFFHKDLTEFTAANYTYLAPGSQMTVFPKDIDVMLRGSYYISLFPSKMSASKCEMYSSSYNTFNDCCEKTKGAICRSISHDAKDPMILSITQPSYYFVRCDDGGNIFNCSRLNQYYFNQTGYNFPADKSVKIPVQKLEPTKLTIRKEYFPRPGDISNMCVLATLDSNCGNQSDKYFFNIHYLTVYHEYIVYISMGIGSVCIFIVSINIYLHCWMRRRTIPPHTPRPENPLDED